MKKTITIVTRTSQLALWQAHFVRDQLLHHHPQLNIEIKGIKTAGDKWLETPLYKIGGKSLFVKELEQALLAHEADIAVHSLKDVPAVFPKGLMLAAICERHSPFDAWVSPAGFSLETLPEGSKVGTSSLRRMVQLKRQRPDLVYASLRGNVPTRLQKCEHGEFDAIVLAEAGLTRLGLADKITHVFTAERMLPAVGQGALGIECRVDDEALHQYLKPLNDDKTAQCVTAERAMNGALGGSCQVPIGGFAQIDGEWLHLRALVGSPDSNEILFAEQKASKDAGHLLGQQVASDLLAQGAQQILDQFK